jgi:hypothetical protein
MTQTFDPNLPTVKDRMRNILGDIAWINPLDPAYAATNGLAMIPDETYNAMASLRGETLATAQLAESLAVRFGQMPGQVTLPGGLQVSWRDRVSAWLELAKRLRDASNAEVIAASSGTSTVPVRRPYEDYNSAEYVRPGDEPWPNLLGEF